MLVSQIRFQSFTAPLLLLGCFSRGQETFPLSPEDDVLFSSPGFQTFEAEFKTWQQPGEKLDENSFVFSAAEVFRFLRDMALDVPMTQSTSLLQVSTVASAIFSGHPPWEPLDSFRKIKITVIGKLLSH